MALPLTKAGHVRTWSADEIRLMLRRMGADPILHMAQIMVNDFPCPDCQRTKGKARYTLPRSRRGACACGGADKGCWQCEGTGTTIRAERVCRKCHGMMKGVAPIELQGHMATKLAPYVAQQLKQVDHISSDGSQRGGMVVRFLEERSGNVLVIESPIGTSAARLQAPEPAQGD